MQHSLGTLITIIALHLSWIAVVDAQETVVSRDDHVWGRFHHGSWTKVRKVTEEFDETGELKNVSTTETRTTLLAVDDAGSTLQLEVTVELGGKRFAAQPRTVRTGFYGETNSQKAIVKNAGRQTLTLGGESIECDILEATVSGEDSTAVNRLFYSDSTAPHILKRETQFTSGDGKHIVQQTHMEVVAVGMPFKVLTELKTVAYQRTVEKHAKGTSHTIEVVCSDIPGGVVAHSSKELDVSGKLIRRSILELVDYEIATGEDVTTRGFLMRRPIRRSK